MMTVLVILHVIACTVLIGLVLIQRGRGAGLVESFAGVESMFGTKTSAFLTRTTTIMSIVFFITCLTLAVMSVRQSKSLMEGVRASRAAKAPIASDVNPGAAKVEPVAVPSTTVPVSAPVAQPDAAKVK